MNSCIYNVHVVVVILQNYFVDLVYDFIYTYIIIKDLLYSALNGIVNRAFILFPRKMCICIHTKK